VLDRVESSVNVHPERRYLAGTGSAALTALEWLVRKPRGFAGAIAIDLPAQQSWSVRNEQHSLQGRRVLLAETGLVSAGRANPELDALRSLGATVDHVPPDDVANVMQLARLIDDWVLSAVPSTVASH
jgi:hypothetical protein